MRKQPKRRTYCYDYPHPAVTADIVVLSKVGRRIEVLLIRRAHEPFKGEWALPGGFVDEDESLESAARRELREETGLDGIRFEQVGAFGDPGRDPRGHTVGVAFVAVLETKPKPRAADDAAEVGWHSALRPPRLAFDHKKILRAALDRVSTRPMSERRGVSNVIAASTECGSGLHVALIEPEIPPNTGNIARLCAATFTPLHLVGKLGFRTDDKALKRAGLDYWSEVDVRRHLTIEELYARLDACRFLYFSTKAERVYADFDYAAGDCLVFGSETRGLPEELLRANWERCLRIPMPNQRVRSLNLATSVGIVLYEAVRQLGRSQNETEGRP